MSTCLVLITLLCCDVCTVEVWRPGWMSQYPGESPHLITTLREAADWGREAVTWPGRTSSHLVQPPVCIRCAALLTPRTTTLSTSLRNILLLFSSIFCLSFSFWVDNQGSFLCGCIAFKVTRDAYSDLSVLLMFSISTFIRHWFVKDVELLFVLVQGVDCWPCIWGVDLVFALACG